MSEKMNNLINMSRCCSTKAISGGSEQTHSFGVDVAKSVRQKHILFLLSCSSVA